jgi:hypothetical protein
MLSTKSAKPEIGGVTPSNALHVPAKLSWQLSPGVLFLSAESINGINPAAENLRLPGQCKSFFDVKVLFSVI